MTGTELLLENANDTIADFMAKVREKDAEIAELRKQLEEANAIIEKLPKTENDWFHRGFAVACAAVARDHDMPSVASDIMRINGITTEQLKAAGVDAADIKEISGRRGGKGR